MPLLKALAALFKRRHAVDEPGDALSHVDRAARGATALKDVQTIGQMQTA